MASQSDIITKASEGALEDIRKNSPEDYAKLEASPDLKAKIIQAARATAEECVQLTQEFAGHPKPEDIAERLAKHLSADRIKLIEGGLSIPTFRLNVIKQDDGKHRVNLTRGDKPFLSSRVLESFLDIDWATIMQYASIIVEAVLLVLSAVGISITPSESVIEGTVRETATMIQSSSQMERAVEAFVAAWDAAGGSAYAKAKALFYLIKDSYSAGILWTIIKSLCSQMHWYDWLLTSAKVSAMLIASLLSDGAALIAEIALVTLSAVDFARKIANVIQLADIKKTL